MYEISTEGEKMNSSDVKILILAYAIQAEIEGMKAENARCNQTGENISYEQGNFDTKSHELYDLAYKHEGQL